MEESREAMKKQDTVKGNIGSYGDGVQWVRATSSMKQGRRRNLWQIEQDMVMKTGIEAPSSCEKVGAIGEKQIVRMTTLTMKT